MFRSVLLVLVLLAAGAAFADTTYVTVGSPVAPNVIPFWGQNYPAFRLQWLYFASELGRPGDIASFDLWGANNLAVEYYNVRVLLCHTGRDNLSTEFDLNYEGNTPVEVIAADTLVVGYGEPTHWYRFPAGFQYDGTSNLLIEFRWRGSAGVNVAFWRNGLGSNVRRIFAYEDDARFGSADTVMANYTRFGFLATGVEEPRAPDQAWGAGIPAVVRGLLVLGSDFSALPSDLVLLDASGRKVMDLQPGENDVSRLSPGVYFLRPASDVERSSSSVRRVVITR